MATLADLIPDPDSVLALEPDELAGVALELLSSSGENEPSRLHPSSFTHPNTIGSYPAPKRGDIALALMEAWSWLLQEGLIAPVPSDTFGWHFITRRGKKIKNREGLVAYRNSVILPRGLLHPVIAKACWSAFLRGDYDTAVFQAFKELEVKIRESSGSKAEEYGVQLVRKAFNPQTGVLTDTQAPDAEKEALMHLVAGAVGSYKNPHSHRKIQLGPEEAVEMIVLSSHLYKIIDAK